MKMPEDYFRPGGAYSLFSHTIKGQPHHMDMLRAPVDRKCSLLDDAYRLPRPVPLAKRPLG